MLSFQSGSKYNLDCCLGLKMWHKQTVYEAHTCCVDAQISDMSTQCIWALPLMKVLCYSQMIKIRNRIMFSFYLRLPHIYLSVYRTRWLLCCCSSVKYCTLYFRIFSISGLSLSDTTITNNSIVLLENIGADNAGALLCTTDRTECCTRTSTRAAAGEWLYPDGRMVPINVPAPPATPEPYYRNRGTSLIRLIRRSNQGLSVNYTGVYCCQIPDRNNVMQTMCVGAYLTESAGESIPSVPRQLYTLYYIYFL